LEIQILKSALRTGGRLIGYYCQFTPYCGLGLNLGAPKMKTPKETLLALADSLASREKVIEDKMVNSPVITLRDGRTIGGGQERLHIVQRDIEAVQAAAVIRELVARMATAQESLDMHIAKKDMPRDYLIGFTHAMECWDTAMKEAAEGVSDGF
jgi:hypothetical protein